jgi:hypothetical protein
MSSDPDFRNDVWVGLEEAIEECICETDVASDIPRLSAKVRAFVKKLKLSYEENLGSILDADNTIGDDS